MKITSKHIGIGVAGLSEVLPGFVVTIALTALMIYGLRWGTLYIQGGQGIVLGVAAILFCGGWLLLVGGFVCGFFLDNFLNARAIAKENSSLSKESDPAKRGPKH